MNTNFGYITPQITMSLGHDELNMITPNIPTMISGFGDDQDAPNAPVAGSTIIFGVMLLGLGSAIGFAMGVTHGVKLSGGR